MEPRATQRWLWVIPHFDGVILLIRGLRGIKNASFLQCLGKQPSSIHTLERNPLHRGSRTAKLPATLSALLCIAILHSLKP